MVKGDTDCRVASLLAMTKKDDYPCYGCGDRRAGCHAVCELYARFAALREERREAAARQKAGERALDDLTARGIEKALRKNGRKMKG